MRIHNHNSAKWDSSRWGSVLLLVLVIVAMLTLAAYNFTQSMTTELEAAAGYTADVQARATADSGLEFVATLLGHRADPELENLIHNPVLFMGRTVSASVRPRANSRFTMIAPVEHDTKHNAIRYGLMDESAKLNLNQINQMKLSDDDLHTLLMNIPKMTIEVVDAMLDWIDTDDTKRPYGAETETYSQLVPPYKAKNGPLESIDELLLIQGITPTLLYGEDANRNGLLDPNENDGDASPPLDNADGVLDHGWVAYLSVHGRESNRRADGRLKINVNDGFLTDLYDAVEKEFDEKTAKFIVGCRIGGPSTPAPPSSSTSPTSQQAVKLLVAAVTAGSSNAGSVTRGGIDLSGGGKSTITSIWQLIGSTTSVKVSGTDTTLKSPWETDNPSSLTAILPHLMDTLTTNEEEFREGRININQARREILLGIPNMTEEFVNRIIDAQHLDSNGQPSLEMIKQHATTGWLFVEGIVDLPTMVSIDPYLTGRGDVYRVQVLGFFDGGGPVARVEAIIDGTMLPPRITSFRDLNELGHGYSRRQMLPTAQ